MTREEILDKAVRDIGVYRVLRGVRSIRPNAATGLPDDGQRYLYSVGAAILEDVRHRFRVYERQMDFEPGWLAKELKAAAERVQHWPEGWRGGAS